MRRNQVSELSSTRYILTQREDVSGRAASCVFRSPHKPSFGICWVSNRIYVPYTHEKHSPDSDVFKCMRLHGYGLPKIKADWKTWPEGHHRWITRNVQTFFSDSGPAQPEVLVIGKAHITIPRTIRQRKWRFLRDDDWKKKS